MNERTARMMEKRLLGNLKSGHLFRLHIAQIGAQLLEDSLGVG
jgi:hypothetical protein